MGLLCRCRVIRRTNRKACTMQQATDFLSKFVMDSGLLQISIGSPGNARYFPMAPSFSAPEEGVLSDVYFGPAQRTREGSEKTDVLGTRVLWVDVDDPVYPESTFPPSAVIYSGHGFHLYWMLSEDVTDSEQIELLNRILINDIPTADRACWNANRLMRVPETTNLGRGDEEPTKVELRHMTEITYTVQDIEVLAGLDDLTRRRVRNGTMQGYRSRSERDWAVVKQLIKAGASDELITFLYEEMPIGDKVHDKGTSPQYLEHTIAKAREELNLLEPESPSDRRKRENDDIPDPEREPRKKAVREPKPKRARASGTQPGPVSVVERDDGYYMEGVSTRRVSTFTLEPKVLLDGAEYGAKDAIVCDVHAAGYTWENITFSRSAFTSVGNMDKETPVAAWQWLGHDGDVRLLLPFLLDKLRENGLSKLSATPTLGMHKVKGRVYFVTDTSTLSGTEKWTGTDGPIVWLPTNREHPHMYPPTELTEEERELVKQLVPKVNEHAAVWTMLGWYAASCIKPWLELQGFRFPILNVAGTKGSGKTSLIQRVFMPLFGQADPRSYDAGTTRFVILSLLGSTNAIPLAFSEFRYESVEKFIRTILMAYDTGHDPRGKADQTTQDYPLSAPFSVDGEDMVSDPAAQERIVLARLRPDTVVEGGTSYTAFAQLRGHIPASFGLSFIQATLARTEDGSAVQLLKHAHDLMLEKYPSRLPDRVRNNYTTVLFGSMLFSDFVGLPHVKADTFEAAIKDVVNLATGRSRTQVDDFTETLVNALNGVVPFKWEYHHADRTVWFQLAPSHNWWVRGRRMSGRGALERDAIKTQMMESPYAQEPKVIDGVYMYGVSLTLAHATGLDVPEYLDTKTFKMNF